MLDWGGIGVNALWVVGLAVSLAALSYADWWAHRHHVRRRRAWDTPMFLSPFFLGLALVSISLSFKARNLLERILWAAWSLLLIGQSIFLWRRADGHTDD